MRDVFQNTARKFKIYMADSATPTAGKTGLTSFTVYLAKDSAAEATVAPTIVERGHGFYEVTPLTSHRDTLGESSWVFVATGAIDYPMKETVVAVDAQTAAFGANTTTPANSDIADAKAAAEAVVAKLPTTDFLAGAATDDGYAVLDTGHLLTALGLAAGNLDEQLADILAASGGGGGGFTAEQTALLVSIAQWAARNNGGPMHYTGNVGDGGVLELTIGDDHETVMENDLPIVVKDPGGLFRAKLVASGSTLSWSAGQDGVGGLITGTVATPTYNSGTELTTIVVQVPNCAAAGNNTATYQWQLKRTSGGKIKTELRGTLRLNADMS